MLTLIYFLSLISLVRNHAEQPHFVTRRCRALSPVVWRGAGPGDGATNGGRGVRRQRCGDGVPGASSQATSAANAGSQPETTRHSTGAAPAETG